MASDIGVRIGIDGEKEFRSALTGVNAQLKNLSSEMRAAVTSMAGLADEEETAARKSDILNRSIQATQQKIQLISGEYDRAKQRLDELGQALENAKREFGENSKEALRAENAYNRQVAAVNRLGTQLNNATADLNQMQAELRQTENAMEDVGNEAADMGSRVSGGFSVMKGAIANVVGDILSSAVDAFKGLVSEALNAADALTKFGSTMEFAGFDTGAIEASRKAVQEYAARTVYDLETVSNTTAQLAANGVKDFVGLTEAAGNLNAVAGGNAETFGSLAMALTQTIGAGKLTTENWNQIADAIPGASGKLQDALRENGAFVGDFRDAMADGEITAEEFSQAIMNLGMTDAAKEAASSVATIEGAIGNLQATIVDGITGLLTDGGMAGITGFINGVTSTLETAGTYIKPAIEMIKSSLSEVRAAFDEAFTPEQQAAITGFLKKLGGALVAVPFGLVATAVEILIEVLKALILAGGAVADFFAGLPDGIIKAGTAFDEFKAAVSKSITEALDEVTQWGEDLISSVKESSSGAVETVSTFFSELPGNIQSFVSDALKNVIAWGKDVVSQAKETGKGFISGVGDFLSGLPGNITDWIAGGIESVIAWGESMKTKAGQKMQEMKDSVKSALSSLPSELLAIGENIVQGLIDGIKNKLSAVRSAAQELSNAVSGKVRDLLGIHSPSRVFMEIGKNVVEGFAVGVKNTDRSEQIVGSFARQMQSVASNITASIPTPASYTDHMAQVGSGVVNGIQSAVAGMRTGSSYTFNLMLPDGTTLARYQLPALIDVARANGTPILNPT